MKVIQGLREWWQRQTGEEETPFDGDSPAFVVSLLVHLGVLVSLGLIPLVIADNQVTLTINTTPPEEVGRRTEDSRGVLLQRTAGRGGRGEQRDRRGDGPVAGPGDLRDFADSESHRDGIDGRVTPRSRSTTRSKWRPACITTRTWR